MFARQIDPFQAYNSALSAAQRHHKDLLEREDLQHQHDLNQRLGQVHQPEMDATKRRKRSFVFEPDFLSALDSAEDTTSSAGPTRPCKKARRSSTLSKPILSPLISSPELPPHVRVASSTKKAATSAHGPSIIDLSSGEELVALHVGESEHKRRRESNACSPDEDSLREVFDVQEDGSLCATMDHAPALPPPSKRTKLEKARPHLRFLDQSDERKDRSKCSGRMDHIRHKQQYRNNNSAKSSAEMDAWMSDDEEPGTPLPIFETESQALVRYQGPKSMSLAEGVDALIKRRLIEDSTDLYSLQDPRGHELVLFRGYRGSDSNSGSKTHTTESSSTVIEELDDEDDVGNTTTSNSAASFIDELQDKIMDMDLD